MKERQGDLISREALALKVRRNLIPNVDADGTVSVEDAERYFLRLLETAPAVDAVEVVHGRWIKDGDVVVCSECGEEHAWDEYRATFCEDCGARMDGE